METLKLNLKEIDKKTVNIISQELKQGKVIVMPTDTIYGLHCLASSRKGVSRLIKIKNRPKNKSFVLIVKSYCMLHNFAHVSKKQDKYIRSVWPSTTRAAQDPKFTYRKRPTTFILESRGRITNGAANKDNSVAIRLTKNELLIKVLKAVNEPLVSTSCNVHGDLPVTRPKQLSSIFTESKPDLVIDSGPLTKRPASRIIDIRNIDYINIIRK
jgi:L-threonylcarbamoyladenylate synthase